MTGASGQPDGQALSGARAVPARKQPVHLGTDAWREARHLYEEGGCGAEELGQRFGVTRQTVERRIRVEGWVRQGHLRELMEKGDTRGLARMVARLIAAFEAQIRAVEAQFLGGDAVEIATDPASVERNARTLGSLAKTLDILIELRGGLSGSETQAERDADGLRRELEKRLERLCREAPAAAVPGGTRPGRT
jgi:hypothetical protein